MKNLARHLRLLSLIALLAPPSIFAGQCCIDAAAAAKKGKMCASCAEKECCKAAIIKQQGAEKLCDKCQKKADRKKEKTSANR